MEEQRIVDENEIRILADWIDRRLQWQSDRMQQKEDMRIERMLKAAETRKRNKQLAISTPKGGDGE